jgi:hypothetical protein
MAAINESPHIGLDLTKYVENNKDTKTPDEIAWDVTYFSREARKAPFPKRANAIVISFDKFKKLVKPGSNLSTDLATYEVYQWAKQATPAITLSADSTSPLAQDILEKLLPLVDFNPQSIMIWLSPRGEIYQEARINVYQAVEVNGQKYLFFWSTPSLHTDQECLAFHQNLLPFAAVETDTFDDVEALRISPISIKIPKTESLTDFLDGQILLPEVWKEIANGQIIKDTLKEFLIVRGLVLNEYGQIICKKTEYQNRLIGARLEMAVQEKLNIELLSGIHGDLNQNALSEPGINFLMTTGRLLSEKNLTSTESVHCGACSEYAKGQKFAPGFKCPKRSQNN